MLRGALVTQALGQQVADIGVVLEHEDDVGDAMPSGCSRRFLAGQADRSAFLDAEMLDNPTREQQAVQRALVVGQKAVRRAHAHRRA